MDDHSVRTHNPKESGSHMLDLLDVSLGAASPPPPSTIDPWGMPAPPRPQVTVKASTNFTFTTELYQKDKKHKFLASLRLF